MSSWNEEFLVFSGHSIMRNRVLGEFLFQIRMRKPLVGSDIRQDNFFGTELSQKGNDLIFLKMGRVISNI